MNAAETAFMYDLTLLKVTRPEPIGYLNLSVSTPGGESKTQLNTTSSSMFKTRLNILKTDI